MRSFPSSKTDSVIPLSSCPLTLQGVSNPHCQGHTVMRGTKEKPQEPGTESEMTSRGEGGGAWWLLVAGVAQMARAVDARGLGL